MTRDVEGAKAFYSAIIGWRFDGMDDPQGGTYWIGFDGDKPAGGILDISAPMFDGVPPQWIPYLAVDDVDARVEKAVQAGAKIKEARLRHSRASVGSSCSKTPAAPTSAG